MKSHFQFAATHYPKYLLRDALASGRRRKASVNRQDDSKMHISCIKALERQYGFLLLDAIVAIS